MIAQKIGNMYLNVSDRRYHFTGNFYYFIVFLLVYKTARQTPHDNGWDSEEHAQK